MQFTQEELDEEYMGLYAPGQMINDPLYGQISYNSSLSNAFKLKLGHISKKHFRPGGMAPSEWTRSVRAVRDTPVADYSAPGINTTSRVAHRRPIAVSLFLPQILQEHSQMLLKAPAVMEVHSGRDEI